MKYLLIICMSSLMLSVTAQTKLKPQTMVKKATVKPEDEIRKYYFVMLIAGNNRTHDSATAVKIQEGHMANINRLYNEGKIKVAGPFGDNGNWRGLFIFDCATKEEVEALLVSDPAVSSGRLAYDIRPWFTAPIGSFKPGKPAKTYN